MKVENCKSNLNNTLIVSSVVINWIIEEENPGEQTLVSRFEIEDKVMEFRVKHSKVLGTYSLSLISIHPVSEIEISLISIISSRLGLELDYVIDKRMIVLKPTPQWCNLKRVEIDNLVETTYQLVNQCIAQSRNINFITDIVKEFLDDGWLVDYDKFKISKLYKIKNVNNEIIIIVQVYLPEVIEFGKVVIDLTIFSRNGEKVRCITSKLSGKWRITEHAIDNVTVVYASNEYVSLGIVPEIVKKLDSEINEILRCR